MPALQPFELAIASLLAVIALYYSARKFARPPAVATVAAGPTPDFRDLDERIREYEGKGLLSEVIVPWYDVHGDKIRSWLGALAKRKGSPFPAMSREELWELYAFSRVSQRLRLCLQPGWKSGSSWAPEITLDDYRAFIQMSGLDFITASSFSPFFHEIVEVDQSETDGAPPELLRELWPAVMLGDLMIARAGVVVSAGQTFMRKDRAEKSTLCWEYCRSNREAADLSHGWGSNSQWRTSFRRDYMKGGYFYFNVDGKVDTSGPDWYQIEMPGTPPDPDDERLTEAERIELLTNRCFVITDKPKHDLHPYHDTCRLPVPRHLKVLRDRPTV